MKASIIVTHIAALAAITVTSASPIIGNRAVIVTTADLSEMKFFSEYAASAYCNTENAAGAPVQCSSNACPTIEADNATTAKTFAGIATDIQGYIAVDRTKSLIIVSFRGSSSLRNWIADILFAQVPCNNLVPGCLVHTGFASAWAEVSPVVLSGVAAAVAANPSYAIVATGHSLGGAIATLAAAYLRKIGGYKVDLYTYGAPRVGNEAFASFVTAQPGAEYRVTHADDPVPRLPPILFNYRHTSPEYWLATALTTYGIADVKVCEGTANIHCNAGTVGLNVDAHLYYFQAITACSDGGFDLRRRRDATTAISNAELEERLNMFTKLDIAYAAALAEQGSATA